MLVTLNTQTSTTHSNSWEHEQAYINKNGAKVAIYLVLILYPLFGVLDYLIAPKEALTYLIVDRSFVVVISLFMLWFIRTASFLKQAAVYSATYMFIVGLGITFMIGFMGGLASPYYAGLNLVMLGCGLLFTWPGSIAAITHGATCILWLLPNILLIEVSDSLTSISNGLFLFATGFIVTVGQAFNYTRLHEQFLTRRDLEQTKINLSTANQKLQELDSFKSRFFANITHELKTPLALILSSTELMLREEFGKLDKQQEKPVSHIQKQGVKLLKLINDLLDLTKLEESSLTLKVSERDIASWSEGLVNEIKPLAERKGIQVTFDSKLDDPLIYFDVERRERVLVNLLSNATKFTEANGKITVTLSDEGQHLQIDVSDTGKGFSPEQAKHLFERFYQTDMGSNRKYGGTGLGLSLSQELVELHGGSIFAQGAEGKGATFTILLLKGTDHFDDKKVSIVEKETEDFLEKITISESEVVTLKENTDDVTQVVSLKAEQDLRFIQLEEASERRVVERDEDEDQRPATVLIAEDNPDITRLLHLGLRKHFKVLAAENGVKAIDLLDRFTPDLVITDLMMPEMDGMALTKSIKTDERFSHIPVLMLSAKDGIEAEMSSQGYPANAYMAKPFSTRKLCKLAQSLTQQH